MRLFVALLLSLLATCNGCWLQSRVGPVNKLVRYGVKKGENIEDGFNIEHLQRILAHLPSGIAWAVEKAGGATDIMRRCDLNGDGTVHLQELLQDSECLNSCWKQFAINSFF